MKCYRKEVFRIICLFAAASLLLLCTSCGHSADHCYLCQGISHDEPCIVNLATGEIAVLSTGSYGHAEMTFTGGVSVTGENGESCHATIPQTSEAVDSNLYCTDCLALIETTSNNGYVLADLYNLNSIKLYPLEDQTILNYTLSVSDLGAGYEIRMIKN